MAPSPLESYQSRISDSELMSQDGSSVVRDFFVDDDGRSALDNISAGPLCYLLGSHSERSIASLPHIQSATSVNTVVTQNVLALPLYHLCEVIMCHRSLMQAEITMTECYAEQIGIITHRFLLLELCRRGGKKPIWLRLDRRTGPVSTFKFLRSSMRTPSNDIGQLAASKEELIGAGRRENRQVFDTLPTLGELRILLLVICEEINTYTVWPANCWFFCSLLQEHLEGTNEGTFVNGKLKHASLAQDVRLRVKHRLQQYYHTPAPPTSLTGRLRSMMSHDLAPPSLPTLSTLSLSEKWDDAQEGSSTDVLHIGIELAQNLHLNAAQLIDSKQYSEARTFGEFSVGILRQLHSRHPRQKQIRIALADALQTYAISLSKSWRTGDACTVSEECVTLCRTLYNSNRKRNRFKLVVSLVLRGICLRDMYRFDDALSILDEAAALARKVTLKNPDENTFNLSITLCHFGMCLLDLGQYHQASLVLDEVFTVNQGSAEIIERAHHSSSLFPVFPTMDGVSMAIGHWRLLLDRDKDRYHGVYLQSLEKLDDVLRTLRFPEAAQKVHTEARWVRGLSRPREGAE